MALPKAPAAAACPECGSKDAEVVDAGDRGMVILGCAECGTVWDAVP